MTPYFENIEGYFATQIFVPKPTKGCWKKFKWYFRRPLYKVTLHPDKPIMFINSHGERITLHDGLISDKGSIPRLLSVIPFLGKDFYEPQYFFHDDGYQHQGVLVWNELQGEYVLIPKEREEVDDNLEEGILAINGAKYRAETVYNGVRGFGWIAWNKYGRA